MNMSKNETFVFSSVEKPSFAGNQSITEKDLPVSIVGNFLGYFPIIFFVFLIFLNSFVLKRISIKNKIEIGFWEAFFVILLSLLFNSFLLLFVSLISHNFYFLLVSGFILFGFSLNFVLKYFFKDKEKKLKKISFITSIIMILSTIGFLFLSSYIFNKMYFYINTNF